ncbi:MAG: GNAT family N-acetyltransferase [Methanomicrobiales archaeon]|nr:GNAT family N-acetyltransferase [Methanomicrobiales archaeon]
MDTIKVRILTSDEYPLWDDLVEISPSGTIFHTSPWIVTAGNAAGFKTELLGAFHNDQLVGGCAIHSYRRGGIFTSVKTTVPLTPYGGIIMQPHESTKIREREKDEWIIIHSLISEIQNKKPDLISFTMSPQVIDVRPYIWQGWEDTIHYCYIFPISGTTLEQHISKNARRSIKKAEKSGIVVSQKWDKDIYWDLTLNTYLKQGKKPKFSQKSLFSLIDKIRNAQWGDMWIAETASGEAASAEILIWDRHMAYRWSAASHNDYSDTGSTSLLVFDIMTYLQKKGIGKYNMMAANTPHLAQFIASFNPELVPYYSVQKVGRVLRILNTMRSIFK